MSYERPYEGLKVVDLSLGIAGPHCAMLLALHGAQVTKVEPLFGDWVRPLGKRYGDHSAMSMSYGRGKRSLALDLKTDRGRNIARKLASDCDVLIESFRPGVADRLGLGYPEIQALNPRALYVSVSGFGQTGPYAERPCTDTVAQAMSGMVSINVGPDGVPHKFGSPIVDAFTGLYAFQAVAPALMARQQSDQGRHIDVSLMQSAAAIMAPKIAEAALQGQADPGVNVPTGSYKARGGWIAIALVREEHFRSLAEVLDRPEWCTDPRYATFQTRAEHADQLISQIREIITERDADDIVARCQAADLLCNRVNSFNDWLSDPHVIDVAAALSVHQPEAGTVPVPRIPGMLNSTDAPAPGIGEHSHAILSELGLDDAEIADLIAAEIVGAGGQA